MRWIPRVILICGLLFNAVLRGPQARARGTRPFILVAAGNWGQSVAERERAAGTRYQKWVRQCVARSTANICRALKAAPLACSEIFPAAASVTGQTPPR